METIDASHPNDIQNEVVAIETILGLLPALSTSPNPSGSFIGSAQPFATVSARIANVEQGVVSDTHTQYVHLRGGDTIIPALATTVGLAIRGQSGQSGDLFSISDATPTKKVWVDSTYTLNVTGGIATSTGGNLTVNGTATVTGTLTAASEALSPAASVVGLVVQQANTPTTDALQIKNNVGSVISRIDSSGKFLGAAGNTATAITFLTGAADATGALSTVPCTYWVDSSGVCHLQGTVKMTSASTYFSLVNTLPTPKSGSFTQNLKSPMFFNGRIPLTFANGWSGYGGDVNGNWNNSSGSAFLEVRPEISRAFFVGIIANGTTALGTTIATGLPIPGGYDVLLVGHSGDLGNSRLFKVDGTGAMKVGGTSGASSWSSNPVALDGVSYPLGSPFTLYLNSNTGAPNTGNLAAATPGATVANPLYIPLDGISYQTA